MAKILYSTNSFTNLHLDLGAKIVNMETFI
jgi:hypothetical protein